MGIRTPDLLIANETLYQLSYDPIALGGQPPERWPPHVVKIGWFSPDAQVDSFCGFS